MPARGSVPALLTLVHLPVPARRHRAPGRQHDLPLGVRRRCRGGDRPLALPRVLPCCAAWSAGSSSSLSDPRSGIAADRRVGRDRRRGRRLSDAAALRQDHGAAVRHHPAAHQRLLGDRRCSCSSSSGISARPSKSEVAYWCHVGGMVAGAVLFPFMKRPAVTLFECSQRVRTSRPVGPIRCPRGEAGHLGAAGAATLTAGRRAISLPRALRPAATVERWSVRCHRESELHENPGARQAGGRLQRQDSRQERTAPASSSPTSRCR